MGWVYALECLGWALFAGFRIEAFLDDGSPCGMERPHPVASGHTRENARAALVALLFGWLWPAMLVGKALRGVARLIWRALRGSRRVVLDVVRTAEIGPSRTQGRVPGSLGTGSAAGALSVAEDDHGRLSHAEANQPERPGARTETGPGGPGASATGATDT